MSRIEAVALARSLVGSRFRPQGRNPQAGLDCVGLVLAVYGIAAGPVRRDYRLRGDHRHEIERELALHFTRRRIACAPGDLMLCAVAADQFHLAIECGGSFVHADAGLGRVVETPGAPTWPVVATYRRRRRPAGKR